MESSIDDEKHNDYGSSEYYSDLRGDTYVSPTMALNSQRKSVIQKNKKLCYVERLCTFCDENDIEYDNFDFEIIRSSSDLNHLNLDDFINVAKSLEIGTILYNYSHLFLEKYNDNVVFKPYTNIHALHANGNKIQKRNPGRPKNNNTTKQKQGKKTGKVWEFLLRLLKDPNNEYLCWVDRREGKFKFISSEKVARLWGDMRGNDGMNYEKLSRAMRYYYKHEVLLPVIGQRLVYKFGPKARGWREEDD